MLLYFVAGPGVIVWDTPVREKQIERTKLGCVIMRKDKTLTPSLDFRLKKNKSVRFVCWLCSRHSVPELWDRKGPSGELEVSPLLHRYCSSDSTSHIRTVNCTERKGLHSCSLLNHINIHFHLPRLITVSLWSGNTAARRIYRCKNFLFEQTNTCDLKPNICFIYLFCIFKLHL